MNSYGLFSPHLTDTVSEHFFQWQGWTGLVACMIAEVILQMRLYALYFLNKKVLAVMILGFIISSTLSAVVMGTILSGITAHAHAVPGVRFCIPNQIGDHFFLFWIPVLCFESLLVGLALFRGFQGALSDGSLFRSGRALVNVLIRDSVLYFLVMFATYLTNMLVWIGAPQSLLEVPIGFSVAMSCVLGNRIILNVRRTTRDAELAKAARDEALGSHLTSSQVHIFSPSHSSKSHSIRVPSRPKHHRKHEPSTADTSFFSPPLPDEPEYLSMHVNVDVEVFHPDTQVRTVLSDVELTELRSMRTELQSWSDRGRGHPPSHQIGWAI
ncbi:hypothetical protein EYR36_003256 [Pleurotus pulmonarius]|nr:hypothetical protein EYR36_003256 [Pleurotus pulmonarius]